MANRILGIIALVGVSLFCVNTVAAHAEPQLESPASERQVAPRTGTPPGEAALRYGVPRESPESSRNRFRPRQIGPQRHSGWYQRPYPYHLDYYRMRYGGSYQPYYGQLYGPPVYQVQPPPYGFH